ncbi:hypothetical protein COB57_05770 [Candidatus Peregrinibacteria bacterium]|nr:MAG: hypothetical protein COB57_05770 [Candidatus Peregrinibacteria bacterium]
MYDVFYETSGVLCMIFGDSLIVSLLFYYRTIKKSLYNNFFLIIIKITIKILAFLKKLVTMSTR